MDLMLLLQQLHDVVYALSGVLSDNPLLLACPFVYGVEGAPATPYASHATPNTEDPTLVLRQAVRGFDINSIFVHGRGAALTTITGIGYRLRRWTTAGSGGTAVTPSPRRIGTTASTTAADKVTAITPGTVSGAYQLAFGCGGSGPGGWTARDSDSAIHVEGGGADEIDINSVCGVASMLHHVSAEISE